MALSQSVHWHTLFYIAALSIIFLKWRSCAYRILTHHMKNLLPLFWSPWSQAPVWPGARTLPYVLAWQMGVIMASVEPTSLSLGAKVTKVLGHCFSLNYWKYLKTMAHCKGFSNLILQTGLKQDHKFMRERRTSALNFPSVQISNVKHSTVLSMIYHDKFENEYYWAGMKKYFDQPFHLMKHFCQSWPVLGWPSE